MSKSTRPAAVSVWAGMKTMKMPIFVVIALINLVIYYPSLFHIARADQWCYLADTADYDDWFSLVTRFYSYNRVRLFNPEDVILFRPGVFLLLGIEKWAFGHNFFYWQLTGVVLHLVLLWYLLRLLLKIHHGIFAYLLVFFFSTLSVIQEMVIWHHTSGYILFMIFVLGALYHAWCHVAEGQRKMWRLLAITGYLALACFCHELGSVFTVFFMLYLFAVYAPNEQPLKRRWISALAVPMVLYLISDYLDSLVHPINATATTLSNSILSDSGSRGILILKTFFGLTISWIYAAIFPLMQEIGVTPWYRLLSAIPDCLGLSGPYSYHLKNPLNYLGMGALIGFFSLSSIALASGIRSMKGQKVLPLPGSSSETKKIKKQLTFLGLLTVFLIVFLISISAGRTRWLFFYQSPIGMYCFDMKYSYIFWVFFMSIIYILCAEVGFERLSKALGGYLKYILAAIIFSLSLMNGYKVFDVNQDLRDMFKPTVLFIEQVDRFIYKHRNESDFSFNVIVHPWGDEEIGFLGKVGESSGRKYYYSDILYKKYLNRTSPKYMLDLHPDNQEANKAPSKI